MKISVVIATNRNLNEYAQKTISSLCNCPHELEIIIVSPIDNFVLVKDNFMLVKDNNVGPVSAYNLGFQKATGNVIQLLTDDVVVKNNWWTIAEQVVNNKIIGTLKNEPIGLARSPQFPTISKEFLNEEFGGYIFNPAYFYGHADNDLGLYCHLNNIPIVGGVGGLLWGNHNIDDTSIRNNIKYDCGIMYLIWGEYINKMQWKLPCSPNDNALYNIQDLITINERITHPECLNRMKRINL